MKVNLGCGSRWAFGWQNFDYVAHSPDVNQCDLRKGIPLLNETAEIVYASHVLEHFSRADGRHFIEECHRILKPGGIIRIVVPDLEEISKAYLQTLSACLTNDVKAMGRYDWAAAEMLDQLVRTHSGGEISKIINRASPETLLYIEQRWGNEFQRIKKELPQRPRGLSLLTMWPPLFSRLREVLIKFLIGNDYKALKVGRFRIAGEVHLWMYDQFSLGRLLKDVGFRQAIIRRAEESYYPNWASFNLDSNSDRSKYKPDSLYMEGIKSL
jgi:predicted SAM-dependent methyltransferase